jgi:hypothetical protein
MIRLTRSIEKKVRHRSSKEFQVGPPYLFSTSCNCTLYVLKNEVRPGDWIKTVHAGIPCVRVCYAYRY